MEDILRKLQSRIDRTSHAMAEAIALGDMNDIPKEARKAFFEDQALDKRLAGYIVSLRRMAKDAQSAVYEEI